MNETAGMNENWREKMLALVLKVYQLANTDLCRAVTVRSCVTIFRTCVDLAKKPILNSWYRLLQTSTGLIPSEC